jgi:hypothetical protein
VKVDVIHIRKPVPLHAFIHLPCPLCRLLITPHIDRPCKCKIAVDLLAFDKFLDRLDMRNLKLGNLRRCFGSSAVNVRGDMSVQIRAQMASIATGGARTGPSCLQDSN